jgi:hypothetical protein
MSSKNKVVRPVNWAVIDCADKDEQEGRQYAETLIKRHDQLLSLNPIAFQVLVEDNNLPVDRVIDNAMGILILAGWSVDFSEWKDTGGRTGTFMMAPPKKR